MMAEGKMGPRGRRTRPQTEPSAQGRERVRRENYLLMEPNVVSFNSLSSFYFPRSSRL